ncbi:MAG: hypothetical protein QGH83_15575 [Candidatus Pacebacteria bacterium]|nr:hypothetical protein [Candidatus Paceibacterota bacterium]
MAKHVIIKGTPVVGANEVLVADSNSKIPAVDGSAVTTMAGGNITGTIPTARLDTGTTANKVVVLGASGLPAVDGSLLTGIVSHTTSASDPAIDTNPSGGVGSEWINSTSGKQYICIDATAGENVWTCSGEGTGNIQPWQYAGSQYGYVSGGYSPTYENLIQRFSFTSDGNSVDTTQNLTRGVIYGSSTGSSSSTHGYHAGGYNGGTINVIDKYEFNTTADATDVGDLSTGRQSSTQTNSQTYGYAGGGSGVPYTNGTEKWAFASDGNATAVGALGPNAYCLAGAGASSATHGYYAGLYNGGGSHFIIEKYSFSVDGNSVDVGDLTASTYAAYCAGASSATHGYRAGGNDGGTNKTNVIDRWSFSSDGDASDVGDLVTAAGNMGGTSSTTHGYSVAGHSTDGGIQKWAYAASSTATSVGNLTTGTLAWGTGNQF